MRKSRVVAVAPGLFVPHAVPIIFFCSRLWIVKAENATALAVNGPAVFGVPEDIVFDVVPLRFWRTGKGGAGASQHEKGGGQKVVQRFFVWVNLGGSGMPGCVLNCMMQEHKDTKIHEEPLCAPSCLCGSKMDAIDEIIQSRTQPNAVLTLVKTKNSRPAVFVKRRRKPKEFGH